MDVADKKIKSDFTTREVSSKSSLSDYQLSRLRNANLIKAVREGNQPYRYSFQDLVVACAIGKLTSAGANFSDVVSAYVRARQSSPKIVNHPSSIKIVQQNELTGGQLLHLSKSDLLDPRTGERAFDFDEQLTPRRASHLSSMESLRTALRVRIGEGNADDWYEYALDCEDDENEIEALRAYEMCIGQDESNADAWVNLGRLHFLHGRQLDAKNCYEQALAIDSDHEIGNYNLGILFEVFESYDLAIRHLKLADGVVESLYCLARIYKNKGNLERADEYMARYFRVANIGPQE